MGDSSSEEIDLFDDFDPIYNTKIPFLKVCPPTPPLPPDEIWQDVDLMFEWIISALPESDDVLPASKQRKLRYKRRFPYLEEFKLMGFEITGTYIVRVRERDPGWIIRTVRGWFHVTEEDHMCLIGFEDQDAVMRIIQRDPKSYRAKWFEIDWEILAAKQGICKRAKPYLKETWSYDSDDSEDIAFDPFD